MESPFSKKKQKLMYIYYVKICSPTLFKQFNKKYCSNKESKFRSKTKVAYYWRYNLGNDFYHSEKNSLFFNSRNNFFRFLFKLQIRFSFLSYARLLYIIHIEPLIIK
jgi:hypothetical protein